MNPDNSNEPGHYRKKPSDDGRSRMARQAGILTSIPLIMVACPLIGGYVGSWLDSRFGTDNVFVLIGVLLGLAAAFRQVVILLKKAEKI